MTKKTKKPAADEEADRLPMEPNYVTPPKPDDDADTPTPKPKPAPLSPFAPPPRGPTDGQ